MSIKSEGNMVRASDVAKVLRPHQYVKNSFVLIGTIFSHQWSMAALEEAAVAFLSFCAMASAVYVFNDIFDLDFDRQHPIKRYRPIASGAVPPQIAWLLVLVLAFIGISLAAFIGLWGFSLVAAYAILNVAYTLSLKHVVILDVFVISTGFMLRILMGTIGLGIQPSAWLLMCGLMLTLLLGFSKRRAELTMIESNIADAPRGARRVLSHYSGALLDQFIAISAGSTILCYGLYTVSPETVIAHESKNLIYTLPLVIYGIFRYLYLLYNKLGGNDTSLDILSDPHMVLTVLGWLVLTVVVLA